MSLLLSYRQSAIDTLWDNWLSGSFGLSLDRSFQLVRSSNKMNNDGLSHIGSDFKLIGSNIWMQRSDSMHQMLCGCRHEQKCCEVLKRMNYSKEFRKDGYRCQIISWSWMSWSTGWSWIVSLNDAFMFSTFEHVYKWISSVWRTVPPVQYRLIRRWTHKHVGSELIGKTTYYGIRPDQVKLLAVKAIIMEESCAFADLS